MAHAHLGLAFKRGAALFGIHIQCTDDAERGVEVAGGVVHLVIEGGRGGIGNGLGHGTKLRDRGMANARILGEAAAPASANCGSRMGRSLFAHEPGRPDCHRTVKKLSQTDLGAVLGRG